MQIVKKFQIWSTVLSFQYFILDQHLPFETHFAKNSVCHNSKSQKMTYSDEKYRINQRGSKLPDKFEIIEIQAAEFKILFLTTLLIFHKIGRWNMI